MATVVDMSNFKGFIESHTSKQEGSQPSFETQMKIKSGIVALAKDCSTSLAMLQGIIAVDPSNIRKSADIGTVKADKPDVTTENSAPKAK